MIVATGAVSRVLADPSQTPCAHTAPAAASGAVLALDAATGEQKWRDPMTDVTDSGILTTASDVLFNGGCKGYFHAIDARSGSLL